MKNNAMNSKIDYEVIVVGAGPAGAMMAKELTERKFKVLVIEKEFEVGYPNKSTAGTPIDTFEVFNLPREVGFEDISGFRIYGPNEAYEMDFDRVVSRVFDFRKLKQYLLTEAIKLGAEVIPGAEVTRVIKEKGKIVGVAYEGYAGHGTKRANVIVDASGPQGVLATKLGLWKKDPTRLGVAWEYFMENARPDKGKYGFYLDLFIGSRLAPGGYGWIFATNDHQVKAGVCKLEPEFKIPNEKSQVEYFNILWKENHQIQDAQPFEIHDCAHYVTGSERKGVLDNFVGIGDVVNKVNPLFAEGCRSSFYSARFAAEAIEVARKRNDYSEKTLRLYEDLWRKKWGVNWFFANVMFDLLYNSDDAALDSLIKSLKEFDPEVLYALYVGKAGKKDYLKLLKHIPGAIDRKIVGSFVKSLLS